MQELVIKNVKDAAYKDVDLNRIFDPEGAHRRDYAFTLGAVASPYATGEGKLCVTFYTLEPGRSNYPYHQHTGVEEVFYIISGAATLKTPKGDIVVSQGDVIVLPPNENGAHLLTNHTQEPMTYLDVDTVDTREVVFYPETGKVRVMAGKFAKSYRVEDEVNYLEGE